jgi:chloride channel 7
MIAAGGAAGVAAAFGAPIGGTLFTYEISAPNTFYTFHLLWRIFFSTAIAVFTISFFTSLHLGTPIGLSDMAILKFGVLKGEASSYWDIPAAIIIGIICGLLGTSFIWVQVRLGIFRKKFINTNFKKLIEAFIFSFMTAAFMFLAVWI